MISELRDLVLGNLLADIVSKWTGIPVTRLVEGEREKLLRLDEILHRRFVGQDEAVRLVADAVIRARSGIKDPRRPIGSRFQRVNFGILEDGSFRLRFARFLDDGSACQLRNPQFAR